jgi:hypothetical protein
MSAQILRKRRIFAIRRLALAAIGVSFFVLSGTTLGADVGIANPSAVAAAPGGRHATAHPTEPPASNATTHSAFVDGLYKELMEWTPPPCLSATSDASLRNYRQKISVSPPQPAWPRRKRNALSPLDGTGGLAAAQGRTASSRRAR